MSAMNLEGLIHIRGYVKDMGRNLKKGARADINGHHMLCMAFLGYYAYTRAVLGR